MIRINIEIDQPHDALEIVDALNDVAVKVKEGFTSGQGSDMTWDVSQIDEDCEGCNGTGVVAIPARQEGDGIVDEQRSSCTLCKGTGKRSG